MLIPCFCDCDSSEAVGTEYCPRRLGLFVSTAYGVQKCQTDVITTSDYLLLIIGYLLDRNLTADFLHSKCKIYASFSR